MIEPEVAFANLEDNIDCAEAYLKSIFSYVLKHCTKDMVFLNRFIATDLIENIL
jgi:asparaginyl-tRNA synthetase